MITIRRLRRNLELEQEDRINNQTVEIRPRTLDNPNKTKWNTIEQIEEWSRGHQIIYKNQEIIILFKEGYYLLYIKEEKTKTKNNDKTTGWQI